MLVKERRKEKDEWAEKLSYNYYGHKSLKQQEKKYLVGEQVSVEKEGTTQRKKKKRKIIV